MRTYASLTLLSIAFANAHAGSFSFDDGHPTFTLPATGTKVVTLTGNVALDSFEGSPIASIELNPSLGPSGPTLGASFNPQFSAYLSANQNVYGGDYSGPILDIALTSTTQVGNYNYGDGLYTPFIYFGYLYDFGGDTYGKYGYAVNVAPVPEPATWAALASGSLIFLRRRRR